MNSEIKELLDYWVEKTNCLDFIEFDPISVPHRFAKKQDIEIAGFFAAIMSWGNRKTIINKANDLMLRMENDPFNFIVNAKNKDLKQVEGFVHRTMNDTDVLYLIDFLRRHYLENESLEHAFFNHVEDGTHTVYKGLTNFHDTVFSSDYAPHRTRKHIANPLTNSACKRLNMYLRWMVRKDQSGVDFGIWKNITTAQLICPLDVHVQRVALDLGIMQRSKSDWKAAIELTSFLSLLDPHDPVKYDYALFGMGISKV